STLGGRTGFAYRGQRLGAHDFGAQGVHFDSDVHTAYSTGCPRSNCASWLAGISTSSLSRKAKARTVANAPSIPTAANHQMCQISAKPITTATNALMKPVGLLFGTSIGSYLRCLGGCKWRARGVCFVVHDAYF